MPGASRHPTFIMLRSEYLTNMYAYPIDRYTYSHYMRMALSYVLLMLYICLSMFSYIGLFS
ncbi:hypothetical protein BD626DRAFT_502284 [Schizophyllum amplum]|uniref:Uncharacterized protein n=1 Tax=Schizophyllum amplum TaxID=97359 RepID=A0A550C9A3_9AGAR|nr:hypothetical protein BD626DRAFT_502284 [Auriculariopsis ampla]